VLVTPGPHLGLRWQLIGGHLAADLVNTVSWRPDRRRRSDKLADASHLADWFGAAVQAHDLAADSISRGLAGTWTEGHLRTVRELREGLVEVLTAQIDHATVPPGSLGLVDRAWRRALDAAFVEPGLPLRHTIRLRAADDAVDLLGLAAGDLCRRADLDRLRRCEDSDCGWLFLDLSRNHTRLWCDPGDCGNRARVRRFSERRRAAAQSGAVAG
jgi:predicted RNA-binding Zn ribbon-like protein